MEQMGESSSRRKLFEGSHRNPIRLGLKALAVAGGVVGALHNPAFRNAPRDMTSAELTLEKTPIKDAEDLFARMKTACETKRDPSAALGSLTRRYIEDTLPLGTHAERDTVTAHLKDAWKAAKVEISLPDAAKETIFSAYYAHLQPDKTPAEVNADIEREMHEEHAPAPKPAPDRGPDIVASAET